ncbi:MAG: hypothetical protein R3249_01700 [Nitriliruptorales bacterium]|nr:hypothetical protein [Nitriliruptorales bacterium]
MRLLVASEDAAERERCTSALALLEDVDALAVESAAAAREQVRQGAVDILVVDGDLRPKGGYSLLYELSAEAELAGSRPPRSIVLVERSEDKWLAEWARADATVTKPVDPFALTKAVRGLMETADS